MSFLSRRKNTPEEPAKKPKAKDPDDYLLALDIGTEFVKALIAKKGKGTMKIVGSDQYVCRCNFRHLRRC